MKWEDKTEFTLKNYESLDELLQKSISDITGEEFSLEEDIVFGGMTQGKEVIEQTYEERRECILRQGYWGFIDSSKVIHYWCNKASLEQLVEFFGHEIGHMTGRHKSDPLKEELRADVFGRVALLSLMFARKAAANIRSEVTVDRIRAEVCRIFDVPDENLDKTSRDFENIIKPRQTAHSLSKKLTNLSLAEIGNRIGGKDHATVLHSIKSVNNLLDTNKEFKEQYSKLLKNLEIS